MNDSGWIKLYRQTLDSDFWTEIDMPFDWRSAFIQVLLSANWKPGTAMKGGHTLHIQRGQLLTSVRKLSTIFHWDRKKVYKWLKYMEDNGMMTVESLKWGTLLTIVKYDDFQTDGATVAPALTARDTATVAPAPTARDTATVATRYKNKEYRKKKEENKSASAGPLPAGMSEPSRGTPEWYKLHYDD